VTTVALAGAGAVGARAGRQLVETPGVERVLVIDRDEKRAATLAQALGVRAEPVRVHPRDEFPPGVDVLATAVPYEADVELVRRAIAAGVPSASVGDDDKAIAGLRAFGDTARRAGVTVAVGCGLAPGMACLLAHHAADALDQVDDVTIARSGEAGPSSLATVRRALRAGPVEIRGGVTRRDRKSGPELVWFPEPVGARECRAAPLGGDLLVTHLEGLQSVTTRLDDAPGRRGLARLRHGRRSGGWGAVRVEVHGTKAGAHEVLVYGVVEQTAVGAGTVLALAAVVLGGAAPELARRVSPVGPGAHGLAALVEPVPFLAELVRRGIKAAAFEGVPVA